MRVAPALTTAVLAIAVALAAAGGARAADQPWQGAEAVRAGLFEAQSELILGGTGGATRAVRRARRAYVAELRTAVRGASPAADRALIGAFADAARAARRSDEVALAGARGTARAAIFQGATAATLDAIDRGDVASARAWLLVREFRTATRFTRPGADATLALTGLQRGNVTVADARAAVVKDLLDAYQARLRELLADVEAGAQRALPVRSAEAAAQAEGYFGLLAARYQEDRGQAATAKARAAFGDLRALAGAATPAEDLRSAVAAAAAMLEGFTAAPLTDEEAARRAQQLLRFLALVPVEYGRGVKDRRVTLDFEIQEAVAFQGGADAALADLRDQLAKRDRARTDAAVAGLARLRTVVDAATRRREGVAPADDVERLAKAVEGDLKAAMPSSWQEPTDESDYDVIALTLDRLEAAVGAGQYRQAEQARLEAYAFFEFGPERRLKSIDPGLALDVEGLVWFGARGKDGLAELIADRAARRKIHETRLALDEALGDAAATLGDSASTATVVTNSAIIVFREGLEAVLILAAITASFVGARRGLRRPVLLGAVAGLLVSMVTWVLAQTLLRSLEHYGERLEAVVGLIAIGVLLLITNWFFHRVYWSEWIAKFHRRRKRLEKLDKIGFISAQALGLSLLGLTSVYREGFETVLFLQSLELSAGPATVLKGAGLGLALTLLVAVATFSLQRKLPYKKMLIVTGVFIGVVLMVMVGQTARTMQGTGWMPITPVDIDLPYWAGLWFGAYPTWETLGAQSVAFVFVIGSYFLAREVQVKAPRRRARREQTTAAAARPAGATAMAGVAPNGRRAGAQGPLPRDESVASRR